jgi:sporulation protein YlmC with PRC-barrel domain
MQDCSYQRISNHQSRRKNMKKATITIITSAALAFAMPLYAADKPSKIYDPEQKAGVAQQQVDTMQSGQMMTAEKLKGMQVVSQEGEAIGEIKTVMIDQQSGEVQFITFPKGGQEVAVPLSAFEFGDGQARLTVDQSKLENVPQQTAEATDSDYLRDLETHYGVAPAFGKKDLDDPIRDPASGSKPY